MIVGIDHVALNAEEIDAAIGSLGAAGYELAFSERGLTNDPGKKRLLRHWFPEHAIAYLRAPQRPAIELTNYGSVTDAGPVGFHVLLGNLPPDATAIPGDAAAATVWREALNCADPRAFSWSALPATGWYDAAASPTSGVVGVIAPVPNVEQAAGFWMDAFRVGTSRRGGHTLRWSTVTVRAAMPQWSMPIVFVGQERPRAQLDDAGFACVALLTTNVGADLAAAEQCGATDSTGLFDVVVNRRQLRVAILRGRGGELIELIQVSSVA